MAWSTGDDARVEFDPAEETNCARARHAEDSRSQTMKIRPFAALLLALPLVSSTRSFADPATAAAAPAAPAATVAPAGPAAGAPAGDDEKDTDLEVRMKKMAKAFRAIRKQVADPAQNASTLSLIDTFQGAAKEALEFTPKKADDVPADQKAKFISDYKAGLNAMIDKATTLKDAVTAGKNDDAVKIVASMFDDEKKEHKEFRRPEQH